MHRAKSTRWNLRSSAGKEKATRRDTGFSPPGNIKIKKYRISDNAPAFAAANPKVVSSIFVAMVALCAGNFRGRVVWNHPTRPRHRPSREAEGDRSCDGETGGALGVQMGFAIPTRIYALLPLATSIGVTMVSDVDRHRCRASVEPAWPTVCGLDRPRAGVGF